MNRIVIRLGIAVIVCGHVSFAGPFGLKEMPENRDIATFWVCFLALCVLWAIEIVLVLSGKTHKPIKGEKYLAKRVLAFMIASVILNTTVITIFLHYYDNESGINHLSFDSIFEVSISLAVASIIFGGLMWYSDHKDIGTYNIKQKLKAENEKLKAENEREKAENERLRKDNIELKEAKEKALATIAQLENQKIELKAEILSLQEQKRTYEAQIQELKEQNTELMIRIEALEGAQMKRDNYDNYVVVSIKPPHKKMLQLDTRDFVFSKTTSNYTTIWYIKDGILERIENIAMTSASLEELLQEDKNITRCNRQHLLNIRYIEYINKNYVKVNGAKTEMAIGITHYGELRDKIKAKNSYKTEQ